MSIEKERTGKPSRFLNDEGWQERTGQPLESAQRSGGVSGDGMLGRADGITRETCPRGPQAPTPGTTLETGKADAAGAGVGVLHSSEEVLVTGMERRRGGCADANGAARTRRWPERDSNTHDARIGIGSSKSAIDALTDERKESDKQHSESRMREIRTSGLMRGRPPGGHWPSRLSSRLGLPTLLIPKTDFRQDLQDLQDCLPGYTSTFTLRSKRYRAGVHRNGFMPIRNWIL